MHKQLSGRQINKFLKEFLQINISYIPKAIIIKPDIIVAFLLNTFDKKYEPKTYPIIIIDKLKINVSDDVITILSPVMLAPIPSPTLFIVNAKARGY